MSRLPKQILTVNPRLKAFSAVDFILLRKKKKAKTQKKQMQHVNPWLFWLKPLSPVKLAIWKN